MDNSVLYIAKWPDDTTAFARSTGGVFQNDEAQNLQDLYECARLLDSDDGFSVANCLYDFIGECASGVSSELKSYENHIKSKDFDFHMIRKHQEFGRRIIQVYQTRKFDDMLSVLQWVKLNPKFKLHRRELYNELQRSIKRARDTRKTVYEAAQEIRMIPNNQSRYSNYRRLSSRALLSKGLEFDCVIIDLSKSKHNQNSRFSSTEMYVAMTRAMKAIYFITDEDSVLLNAPKGVL